MRVSIAIVVLGLLLLGGRSKASGQGPPIQTDTPIMLGLDGRGVRSFLKVVRKDRLLHDGGEITDPMNRRATAYVLPIIIPYNLATRFQIGVVTPFVEKNFDTEDANQRRSGFGDMTLYAKMLMVQRDRKGETFRIAVKGRVKLPTGSETTMLPLGTGSTDYGGSVVAGWVKGRWGLYGEALFTHNTTNAGFDYGDRYGFNLALGFRAMPGVYHTYPSKQINLYLELNGSSTNHDAIGGVENPDSGGTLVFLSPGLQYVGGRRWLMEASAQFPMIDEPNGTQLATSWTLSVGTRILVF